MTAQKLIQLCTGTIEHSGIQRDNQQGCPKGQQLEEEEEHEILLHVQMEAAGWGCANVCLCVCGHGPSHLNFRAVDRSVILCNPILNKSNSHSKVKNSQVLLYFMKNTPKPNSDRDPWTNGVKSCGAKDLFLPLKYKSNVENTPCPSLQKEMFSRHPKPPYGSIYKVYSIYMVICTTEAPQSCSWEVITLAHLSSL